MDQPLGFFPIFVEPITEKRRYEEVYFFCNSMFADYQCLCTIDSKRQKQQSTS